MSKRNPIRVGDRFKSGNGTIWIITEVGLFGRPHWVVSEDRQTIFSRATLETMTRVESKPTSRETKGETR